MKVYSSMPLIEFVEGWRDRFCAINARPVYIDKLDELASFVEGGDLEDQLEKARADAEMNTEARCQSEIDELRNENDRLAARVAELEAELDQIQSEAADRID